jgi:hypothetical protein
MCEEDEAIHLLEEYLNSNIKYSNPCEAQACLQRLCIILLEKPYSVVEGILDKTNSNKEKLPPDFIDEVKFQYMLRGGKIEK